MNETVTLDKELVVDMFSALLATKSLLESIFAGEKPGPELGQAVVNTIQQALDNTPEDVRGLVIEAIVKNIGAENLLENVEPE
ncbi:hypothetical protein SEA_SPARKLEGODDESS_206 [Streptomyces phage SparkleGoddess]|uniref:Uncharacterized protein n=1 Tax=Streptomyces phage SparkleGoddess TaxID=2283305 RepID=A0A345MEA4_9CAUD|nr:hypothetical protein SEA_SPARKLEGODDESS_206 [Streptomyces phage SparkleGoddess]UTN92429.1 hypothetical protein SEA_STIGMA_205 [Streptomyces phage Stigma]